MRLPSVSSSSMRRSSLRSCVICAKPRNAPSVARSAVIVTSAGNRPPPCRTRHPTIHRETRAARAVEQGLRLAGVDVFLGVEDASAASDSLVGAQAVNPFGPSVPAEHEPFGVEHDDGVVLHALDQQPQVLFAQAQPFFLQTAPGEVARDFRKPEQLPARVAHRGDDDVGPEPAAVLADAPAFVLEAAELGAPFPAPAPASRPRGPPRDRTSRSAGR